jgi:hypothetical protein
MAASPLDRWTQLLWLGILALVVACVAWTVTHEEILREPRDWCARRAQSDRRFLVRKTFYVVTCEYCFSHWVALAVVALMRFRMLAGGWRGYVVAFFAVTAVANLYLSAFGRLRQEVRSERLQAAQREQELERQQGPEPPPSGSPSGSSTGEG